MNCSILHESKGRMRIHVKQARMTIRQADVLAYYLNGIDGVRQAQVYERTGDAVICYRCARETVSSGKRRLPSFRKPAGGYWRAPIRKSW